MKFQIVLQFPEEVYCDLDWIAALEDRLAAYLIDADIDGHDIGNGEINIFIYTNNPIDTFETIKKLLKGNGSILDDVKIAYRKISENNYICLWPEGLTEFIVT